MIDDEGQIFETMVYNVIYIPIYISTPNAETMSLISPYIILYYFYYFCKYHIFLLRILFNPFLFYLFKIF